jgi:hypothetical protein
VIAPGSRTPASPLTLLQTARYRAADQTLYASPTQLVPIARQFVGRAITVPVGGFVRPFRYNQR